MYAVPGVVFFTLGFYVVVLVIFQLLFSGLGHYVFPVIYKDGSLGSIWIEETRKVYKNSLKLIYHVFKVIYTAKTWVLSNHLGIEQSLYLYYQTEGLKLMVVIGGVQFVILIVST